MKYDELKGSTALVQFLSVNDKKEYDALIKTLEKDIGATNVKHLVTNSGEVRIMFYRY